MGRQQPTVAHIGEAIDRLAARQVAQRKVHEDAAARALEATKAPAPDGTEVGSEHGR